MRLNNFYFSLIVVAMLISGCTNGLGLVKDIYSHKNSSSEEDAYTSIIALSNIALDEAEIDSIRKDFLLESDSLKKYLLSYLLSKRTQEYEYISYFISE